MGHILFVFGAQACVPEDALLAARDIGLRISVIAPQPLCGAAAELADRIEITSVDCSDGAVCIATRIHQENRIDGVLAYDDQAVPVVARIADALDLPGHPVTAADAARDKVLMKRHFAASGIPIAPYTLAESEEMAAEWATIAGYPVVVKPVRGSASQGVIRANDEEELRDAYRRVRQIVRDFGLDTGDRSDAEQLVEKYLPGSEYSIELLLQNGAPNVLCTFEKPVPLEGPFFEETIYLTPASVSALMRQRLEELAVRAALALGLRDGAAHCELRVTAGNMFVLEIGARLIGGACSRVFQHALGESIHPALLRIAMGQIVNPPEQRKVAAGAMMLPIVGEGKLKAVKGIERAQSVPGVRDAFVTTSPGAVILAFPEQSCYVGFVTAVGDTPSETATALAEAARAIEFELEPLTSECWSRDLQELIVPESSKYIDVHVLERPVEPEASERIASVVAEAHFGHLPRAMAQARARECIRSLEATQVSSTPPSFWLVVGERDGVALGSVSNSTTGHISCLAAVPGKRGLETALANFCMERLAQNGAKTVEVELDLRQPAVASLYRQLGFRPKAQDRGSCCC